MFEIKDNKFEVNGRCTYEDEYGNTAFFRKTDSKIVGKLRFANENVSVEPLYLEFPLKKEEEHGINLAYKGDSYKYIQTTGDDLSSVTDALNGFTELVRRWIGIYYAIETFIANNDVLRCADPSLISDEDVYNKKIAVLSQYDEVLPLINTVFNNQ